MSERLLPPEMIPQSLRCGEGIFSFPTDLAEAYRQELVERGLLDSVIRAQVNGGTGGRTQELTIRHFIENFSGSCGRMKLAILDPNERLDDASNLFVTAFSGGKVALLDAPCGSGAASLTLLSLIAALRRDSVLPRLPLEVHLVCADISESALQIAERLLGKIQPNLEREAIVIRPTFRRWDMQNEPSTVEMIHAWATQAGCTKRFLLKANTSGFLNNPTNFNGAEAQLRQLLLWANTSRATAIWIEPQMSAEPRGLRANLGRLVTRVVSFFRTTPEGTMDVLNDSARLRHPIRAGEIHDIRLSLMRSRS